MFGAKPKPNPSDDRAIVQQALIALNEAFELSSRKLVILGAEQAAVFNEIVAAIRAAQPALIAMRRILEESK
jgi:hypothetical protein